MAIIDFFYLPEFPCQSKAITRWGYRCDRANFLRTVIDNMLFIVFENRVEAEVIYDFLPRHPDNQTAFIHLLDLSHA
ncbi:hypothetical protein D3C76_708210 [compost metagenome]